MPFVSGKTVAGMLALQAYQPAGTGLTEKDQDEGKTAEEAV